MKEITQAKIGLIGFVVVGMFIMGWYGYTATDKQQKIVKVENTVEVSDKSIWLQEQIEARKARNRQAAIKRQQAEEKLAKILTQYESQVNELISSGVVDSVNVEFNEVRIDPAIWLSLDLKTKQGVVLSFSQYFDVKGSTGHVTILSNRNDKKLGSYSSWSGIKIYQ